MKLNNKTKKWNFFQETGTNQPWWMIVFISGCCVFYFHAIYWKEISYQEMMLKVSKLESEKTKMSLYQQELVAQINSQKDPRWIEMILKKKLGMVPENQIKVYFKDDT